MIDRSTVHFACCSDRNYLYALVATVAAVCRKLPARVQPASPNLSESTSIGGSNFR